MELPKARVTTEKEEITDSGRGGDGILESPSPHRTAESFNSRNCREGLPGFEILFLFGGLNLSTESVSIGPAEKPECHDYG